MNLALVCHDPATGRITIHELPTIAVIEPCAATKEHRMWTTEVDIHLANGRSLMDTSPGDAIMEVLGLSTKTTAFPGGVGRPRACRCRTGRAGGGSPSAS